jgi:endonuclease/exonuclease/phosphatase family metal-dependent hydrolase
MTPAGKRVRVLTWNVHGCVGRSGRFDPDAVVNTVRRLQPDIAALQEVDARRHVTGGVDTFAHITDQLGGHAAEARTIRTPYGDYGHLLISRWPLEQVQTLDLSVAAREPRAAIVACTAERWLHVAAAHLGLNARERRRQLGLIRGVIDERAPGPCVVLGDFNEWRRKGVATKALCPPFVAATTLPTYPAGWPVLPLDRIWYRPPLELVSARVVSEVQRLSDHLPVLAELRIDARFARYCHVNFEGSKE